MPLDLIERPADSAPPMPKRRIFERDNAIALLEVADGDARFLGPETSHSDLEQLAKTLLSCTGPGAYLPPLVHKLCLGYLAARQVEVVS